MISVIMAVYNCEATLGDAVESIISQTYQNWELVICDDASTDGTATLLDELVERHGAERIVVTTNTVNRKLPYSLNRCIELANGELIARMDGDDRSEPDRFERQTRYLLDNPDIDLVGTSMRRFNDQGSGDIVHPASPSPDRWTLGRTSVAPFCHATIVARRAVFDRLGGYTVSWRTERGQDIDLWFRFFAAGFAGRNLAEALYLVREDASAIRRRTRKARLGEAVTRVRGSWELGYPPQAYLRVAPGLLKALVPYWVFDWQRARSRSKVDTHGKGRPTR